MKTTKGFAVFGLQTAYHPKSNIYRGWSGRVRVIDGDPYFDECVKWNSDGSAFRHEHGDLVFREGKRG